LSRPNDATIVETVFGGFACMKKSLYIIVVAWFSVVGVGLLLILNPFVSPEVHGWLSSFPLAVAGVSYILLQFRLKPPLRTLLKRLLLASAFLMWAVDQLLPAGRFAVFLGDAVIAAYVVDLFWMIRDQQAPD
jgi:hypothetical protein